MPATETHHLAALTNADRLAVRLRSLRRQRSKMADFRKRRAAEPPHITAGRVADVLAAAGPLHRDAVRRKLNLPAAALSAAIDHGVANGLFRAEHQPAANGRRPVTYLHPPDGPRRYRRTGDAVAADEAYNGEFRRLAQEHFARLPLAEQVRHQPKLDQFVHYNHMRAITAETLKRGGTPDDAHDLAVRMLYGGSTQSGSPLFAAHDLGKRSYLTRFVGYRNALAPKYAAGGLHADATTGRTKTFSDVSRRGGDFASGVARPVRQTDLLPANAPSPLGEASIRKVAAADRPDARADRLRRVAAMLAERKSLTQIGAVLGLRSKTSVKRWADEAKAAKYNKVEYFADLAEPAAVLRYARWKSRPFYVVFLTKTGKKKRRIIRFDGTHDDLRAECVRRGQTLLYSEPATDAHTQIVGAASGGGE